MKERETDALAMPWLNARVAHLLSVHRAVATLLEDQTLEGANPNGYDEVVFMRNAETIEAFSSQVISVKAEKAYKRECMNIMTQALQTEDSALPKGPTIQNAYTKLWKGSKYIVMVVRNSMAYPQMLQKSSSCDCGARNTTGDQSAKWGRWTSGPSSTQFDYKTKARQAV